MTRIHVNGVGLDYSMYGDDGPPVVLVMGVGWRAAVWQLFAVKPLLARGYRVLSFDNRGTTPSDVPPGPYTVDDFARDTIGLLDSLGIGDARLWGISVGGLICQEVARRRPDLVKGAVCQVGFGWHSLFGQQQARAMLDLMRSPERVPESLALLLSVRDALRPSALHDDQAVQDALDFLGSVRSEWDQALAWQLASVVEWAERDHSDELRSIDVPLLVLGAEHDASFPPSQLRQRAALCPRAHFVELEGANHVPMFGFNKVVRLATEFFSGL